MNLPQKGLARRRRGLARMEETIRGRLGESETESQQALSAYDNHPADLAADTFYRELDVGLDIGLQRHLDEVRRAQQKLSEGTYGICDRCGRPISPARLSAMPEALYCIQCQRAMDEPYIPSPSEAEVVPFPFGARGDIHRDVVESDGEDIWQSVAQVGNSDTPSDTPPAVDYNETFIGFDEPIGYVADIESIVDENGEVLFDALRQKAIRDGESTDAESDGYPE